MKQNIEFYPHYANSDQHAKFKMLRVQFGWEGEGKFWALNNRIALSEGCCLDISKKYNKAAIANDLNFTLDEFDKFIIFLKDDCELIKECENGTITTDIIQEVFGKVMQERGKARERHRRTLGEKQKTSGEKIHRVKESKVKESKVKEPIVFPIWLNKDLWSEYKKHRQRLKAPMTPYAEKLAIDKLSKFVADGNNPNNIIKQSIDNGWKGLFPLKNDLQNNNNNKLQPQTYAQAKDAEQRGLAKWLLKKMEVKPDENNFDGSNDDGSSKTKLCLPESTTG